LFGESEVFSVHIFVYVENLAIELIVAERLALCDQVKYISRAEQP